MQHSIYNMQSLSCVYTLDFKSVTVTATICIRICSRILIFHCFCVYVSIYLFFTSTIQLRPPLNLVVGVAHIVQRSYEILLASNTYRHDQHTHEHTCSVCVYDAERKRERICGGNGVALFVNVSVLLASQRFAGLSTSGEYHDFVTPLLYENTFRNAFHEIS